MVCTLYNWMDKPNFNAYCNRLQSDMRDNLEYQLSELYSDATSTIKSSLKSSNESVKLKAAIWVIEKYAD